MDTKELIQKLGLKAHPEGGYYKETFQSNHNIFTNSGKTRKVYTTIYYLLENEDRSIFHRLESDELWFFHQGNSVEIITIQNGQITKLLLGNNIENGELPQAIIVANTWFAAKIQNESGYSLVSCVVAPGFDFEDFHLANREELKQKYPQLNDSIEKFTN